MHGFHKLLHVRGWFRDHPLTFPRALPQTPAGANAQIVPRIPAEWLRNGSGRAALIWYPPLADGFTYFLWQDRREAVIVWFFQGTWGVSANAIFFGVYFYSGSSQPYSHLYSCIIFSFIEPSLLYNISIPHFSTVSKYL